MPGRVPKIPSSNGPTTVAAASGVPSSRSPWYAVQPTRGMGRAPQQEGEAHHVEQAVVRVVATGPAQHDQRQQTVEQREHPDPAAGVERQRAVVDVRARHRQPDERREGDHVDDRLGPRQQVAGATPVGRDADRRHEQRRVGEHAVRLGRPREDEPVGVRTSRGRRRPWRRRRRPVRAPSSTHGIGRIGRWTATAIRIDTPAKRRHGDGQPFARPARLDDQVRGHQPSPGEGQSQRRDERAVHCMLIGIAAARS